MFSRLFNFIARLLRPLRKLALTAMVTLASFIGNHAFGWATIRVDGANGLTIPGGGNGQDWAHAYLYLQDGLDDAVSGD